MNRGLRPALSVLAALLLAACAGGEPAQPDQHFRLSVQSPAALGAPALSGTLLVKRFAADGLLAQRPVVYAQRRAPQALYQYSYHLWADSPTVMLQVLVAGALREARVAGQVVTPAHGVESDHVLVGRIERFEHLVDEAPAVAVRVELGVFHAARRELLWLRDYSEELEVASPGVAPAVAAMNEAMSRILARFVADLAAL